MIIADVEKAVAAQPEWLVNLKVKADNFHLRLFYET
jgi:hypothetical protein